MAERLTPEQFNKPCLLSYGEIAERLAYFAHRLPPSQLKPFPWTAEQSADWGHIIAEAVLKLEKVDVR